MGDGQQGPGAGATSQRAVEDSLRRLQTDVIDLYQSHDDDPGTPLEETLERLRRADQGRQGARDRRVELHRAARLAEALAISAAATACRATRRCSRSTTSYDRAGLRGATRDRCAAAADSASSPSSRWPSGFLTGKYRSEADLGQSARGQGVKKYLNARGLRILAALDEVAKRAHATPGAGARSPG